MANQEIELFNKGVHNILPSEVIPKEAFSDAKNWITKDGKAILVNGRINIGAEGLVGEITGEIFGYKTNGDKVHWRKAGTQIEYSDGTNWVAVVTGLTEDADYSFANYSSLAGTFTFAFGVDGIYKMHNANPGSFISLYDSTKNFKGRAIIYQGRAVLWNRAEDKTGLYGSYIDAQNSTVYTTVTGEATTSLGGTLAFKAGGATRNAFGVQITLTGTGEVYTDNFLGVLTGNMGGTGTINYVTGVYTLSNPGVGTANYQWENSNNKGVTDFTHSATRLAGEGFVFRQDEGGDPILTVLVGLDYAYYSIKSQSVYRLFINSDDLTADNNIFRKEIGISSWRGAASIQTGIVFMNTANPEKPELTILQKNPIGGDVEPAILFPQFKFANYNYDDMTIDSYDRYIVIACRTKTGTFNEVILLCNQEANTVDITYYPARTFAKDGGKLYAGSPITKTVYSLYDGFDDMGLKVDNFLSLKDEKYGSEDLKKVARLRFKGYISRDQGAEIYFNPDGAGDQLIGTILGTADYVDSSGQMTIGGNMVGTLPVGGGNNNDSIVIYPYFMEIKLKKLSKFRNRKLTIRAIGFGYVDLDFVQDHDIDVFEGKMPSRFRQKQNVSIDGTTTDMPNPEF